MGGAGDPAGQRRNSHNCRTLELLKEQHTWRMPQSLAFDAGVFMLNRFRSVAVFFSLESIMHGKTCRTHACAGTNIYSDLFIN